MNHKLYPLLAVFLIFVLGVSAVQADGTDSEEDYPWRDHEGPFDFVFGNMIDSHQQSMFDSNGLLHGFIYIHFTGDYTEEGIPIARKADCTIESCSVGWVIKGIPYEATLKNKGPRVWLIDPAGLPKEPGYTHFQWTGCPKKPHGLIVDREDPYQGYLLKRVAVTSFYWLGGGGIQGGGGGGCSSGGGCSGDDGGMGGSGSGGGCSGHEGEEGDCSGGGSEMGGGSSGHSGRLVTEGPDSHSNVVTQWDGTWQGGGCED